MTDLQALFVPRRDIGALHPAEARVVLAMRSAVVAHRMGREPNPPVAERLSSPALAEKFSLVMAALGDCWPEAFRVGRPCCPMLSHDEALLVDMMRAAACCDRAGFDLLLHEMIGADGRAALFGLWQVFLDAARP